MTRGDGQRDEMIRTWYRHSARDECERHDAKVAQAKAP